MSSSCSVRGFLETSAVTFMPFQIKSSTQMFELRLTGCFVMGAGGWWGWIIHEACKLSHLPRAQVGSCHWEGKGGGGVGGWEGEIVHQPVTIFTWGGDLIYSQAVNVHTIRGLPLAGRLLVGNESLSAASDHFTSTFLIYSRFWDGSELSITRCLLHLISLGQLGYSVWKQKVTRMALLHNSGEAAGRPATQVRLDAAGNASTLPPPRHGRIMCLINFKGMRVSWQGVTSPGWIIE